MSAVFAIFATGAAVAQAADAPVWLAIVLANVAAVGALMGLLLIWLEQKAEREGDTAERFRSAAMLLGDADARLGAIYVLERIAQDAPESHHGPIVELLSAYVRGHAPWPPLDIDDGDSVATPRPRPAPDVQAALTVLGRRDYHRDDSSTVIRLSDVDLRGAFLRGGHFERARFRRTHLEGAHFEGAYLQDAKFRDAHLEGANFQADNDLQLPAAHLDGAEFPNARWDRRTKWPPNFDADAAGCRRIDRRD